MNKRIWTDEMIDRLRMVFNDELLNSNKDGFNKYFPDLSPWICYDAAKRLGIDINKMKAEYMRIWRKNKRENVNV